MQEKKKGFPEEGEIVVCMVRKIQRTTVFVQLEEYEHKEGIIHISEISPGRIRTIRDFVKEGKKIICKVLRKNERYGNLDLSLRRVTTGQKLNKLREIKLEDKCKKIIESVSKQLKLDPIKIYKDIEAKLTEDLETVGQIFQEIADGEDILPGMNFDKKVSELLEETIKARLKPQEIKNIRDLELSCPTSDGIESIKKTLKKAIELAKKKEYNVKINYVSAPKYNITITASEPRELEMQTEEILEAIKTEIEKENGHFDVHKPKK
ncbi:S1 RNA-binding domain-containing protein [Candidatus Woesearchaeota archaeon]|jgi:translation initiation factor 2 subunit 1|nr:S1 RNA-binding domain-containing protein [Candidatus Woesearchaeota archaeon]MBT6044553.1 S1 RNA-binding domain-containing protein [Candidatus Woesearchaeota archaeon]